MEKVLTYTKRKKKEVYAFLGNECINCGNQTESVLQIDHVYSDGNVERRTQKRGRLALYHRVMESPERYQLLCANCNWEKRSVDFKVQRGLELDSSEKGDIRWWILFFGLTLGVLGYYLWEEILGFRSSF